jgi:hypothetical protein
MTTETFVINEDGEAHIAKDPRAKKDYSWSWTAWLALVSDTLSSYTIDVDGVTLVSDTNNAGVVTAWISGGTAGQIATATCHIITTGGREDDMTMYFDVDEQ